MNKSFLQRAGASFAAVLAGAAALPAYAAAQVDAQLPPEHDAGKVSYLSGGIGEGEAHRFEAAFGRYPLVVQLFEQDGKATVYTADAQVKITDRKGDVVFDRHAEGPFMLLRLPAGDYRVAATLRGQALAERSVHVTDSGHARATFVFPQAAG
ncbi:MAG: carboxypeptidase regulatory-like domain-containing protein [Proteobacteria bacterium]|nr:carboxypeptidase regulatory-like domain-containing protein [Pseudomonadota bacterium]